MGLTMRDEFKAIRDQLKDWGEYRRAGIGTMGYLKKSVAFDPTNNEELTYKEPSYLVRQITEQDERRFRAYQMKQRSTAPKLNGRTPFYFAHKRLNKLDRKVSKLPDNLRSVIVLKFEKQLKNNEIAVYLSVSTRTIEDWTARSYEKLIKIIDNHVV